MKVEEFVRSLISNFPDQFPYREACLNHALIETGTGFHWNTESGELDSEILPESENPPVDLDQRCKPFEERMKEEKKVFLKSIRGQNDFWSQLQKWEEEKCPLGIITEFSPILNFPQNLSHEWSDTINELFMFLYKSQKEAYEKYKKRAHKHYLEYVENHLKEELEFYEKTGVITTWLQMQALMEKHDHKWFARYGKEYFEGDPRRYGRSKDHFKFLESFLKEKRESPTYATMVEFMKEKWNKNPCSEVCRDLKRINGAISDFGQQVWAEWLQEYYSSEVTELPPSPSPTGLDRERLKKLAEDGDKEARKVLSRMDSRDNLGHGGYEAVFDGVQMIIWGCAGRVLITLRFLENTEKFDEQVTLIGLEREPESSFPDPGLNLQGISASAERAIAIIEKMVEHSQELRSEILPNSSVSCGI